jgi:23S rRNA (cytidine1920-2'-O)/16S rRNA (cytidine1409-2'-O)-methyltransferase
VATRRRLDAEMVRRGLAGSRTEARTAIEGGLVTVGGRPASKPSTLVGTDEALDVLGRARRFVSRGGEKLDAALERFGIDVVGRHALDAGASTGGFTDVLLRRGAAHVAAVDVGYGQLAWSLREDPRVTVLERTNVRDLTPEQLPFAPSVVVADLSFISLRTVVAALAGVSAEGADLVLLVKPQFEAGPADVGKGGVVRDPAVWRRAIDGVVRAAGASGLAPQAAMASPLPGPAGNVEFLLWARVSSDAVGALDPDAVDAAVEEGLALRSAS